MTFPRKWIDVSSFFPHRPQVYLRSFQDFYAPSPPTMLMERGHETGNGIGGMDVDIVRGK